jgi:hypothetical protein
MAIQHLSTKLCDYLIRADNGRLSLVGTFNNLVSHQLPVAKSPCGLVVELLGDEGDPFTISLEGHGMTLLLAEGEIHQPPTTSEFEQSVMVIQGDVSLLFPRPGRYYIVVRSGEEVIHATPFGVLHEPLPAPAPAQ